MRAASAQSAPTATTPDAVDSMAVAGGRFYYDNAIKGYGKAEILGSDGKTHQVFIPISVNGFAKLLPFYRREEDLRRFGTEPLNIDVDKVQSIRLNDLYQEHMVVQGKRKHILASRLAEGPVELFNYTEVSQAVPVIIPLGGVSGPMMMMTLGVGGIPNRTWYLRRKGELMQVSRAYFLPQMAIYFQDDAELVAALQAGKLHYKDMLTLVRTYNRHKAEAASSPAGTN